MNREFISYQEVLKLYNRQDIHIFESHNNMPKVISTGNGEVIKFFYKKTWFSSNYYAPYAIRFLNNSRKLQTLGVLSPEVTRLKYCQQLKAHIIHYKKLPGDTLLSLIQNGNHELFSHAIKVISYLHKKGIFFRGIHLSNIIYQSNNNMVLVDVTDMAIKDKPLSLPMRYRNLQHLFFHKRDYNLWKSIGMDNCVQQYLDLSGLSECAKKILSYLFKLKLNLLI